MQVLKEHTNNDILNAAADEFYFNGYKNATLRNIAQRAKVNTTNIYSYFKNKAELFDAVVKPIFNNISSFAANAYKSESIERISIRDIAESISDFFIEHKKQFMILFNGSEGTKYEGFKHELYLLIAERIKSEYILQIDSGPYSQTVSEAFSWAILEGILYIINKSIDEQKNLKAHLNEYLKLSLKMD